ncbi:MAG: HDOD domain-containing protein [Chitinivibrionales bacterium]|nr:HDOD domain-containing protein [Chitinivibrionales bacterium]
MKPTEGKAVQIVDKEKIKQVTEKIIGLPTLPTVISKMLELVDNPKTSTAILAKLISTDQALTSRILKLANSAYYGFAREIYTVDMAIVVMGFNAVKEMGLSLSVFDMFKEASNCHHFDITQFWRHCIGCAVSARILAKYFQTIRTAESFVAGLLHDMGKIIINQYFNEKFVEIITTVLQTKEKTEIVEERILGAHHGTIGGWLANRWHLPHLITDTVSFHHNPWDGPEAHRPFIALITCADYLCHTHSIGSSGRADALILDSRVSEILYQHNQSFDPQLFDTLSDEIEVELDRIETITSRILPE